MIKDFKYIIKRIIIGVGIALVLMFLKGNVYAMEVVSAGIGNTETAIDNTTTTYVKSISGNPFSYYANTRGYIRGTFSIQKIDGTATSINIFPKQVYVNTNTNPASYVCEIGSAMTGNSTFNGGSFTYKCPIRMGSSGVSALVFDFQDIQTNFNSIYRLSIGSLMSYEIVENASINVDTSGTTNAINNQITNDNSNTQSIINNQNSNTDKEIESQKVCKKIDKANITDDGHYLIDTGQINGNANFGITDFYPVSSSTIKVLSVRTGGASTCFYNVNKSVISCIKSENMSVNQFLTIPSSASFVRFSINKSENKPTFELCTNGNQAIVNSQQEINNTINNDNVDTNQAGDFFSSFQSDSHGLSGIITSPLRLIQSLSSSQCSSLVLPLPFVNQSATIPCMSTVYSKFPTFYNLWQLISTGLIAYYILINLFAKVHSLQNPQDDRIEVLNL